MKTLNLKEMEVIEGGWFNCMKRFFASDAGVAVTVMGIAGGCGATPLSWAAGAITGAAALGCLAE